MQPSRISFLVQSSRIFFAPASPTFGLTRLWSLSPKVPRITAQFTLCLCLFVFSYDIFSQCRTKCRDWLLERYSRQLEDLEDQMKLIAIYLEDQRRFLMVLEFMELPFHEETLGERDDEGYKGSNENDGVDAKASIVTFASEADIPCCDLMNYPPLPTESDMVISHLPLAKARLAMTLETFVIVVALFIHYKATIPPNLSLKRHLYHGWVQGFLDHALPQVCSFSVMVEFELTPSES
ncbi:hypothetical protein BT96DRAFT_1026245 [Gymnopus androsaceus JB14]|uniref:Uncharacterized protein n=1 Tax=Gymnopus androsaceus JB14 TaxID=1447944 RepID=A0A6A4GM71_9AGAR|nr:hypothetical protein BT96DRAFT_1026245 [Gymnopus androsaceus JB14]